MARTERLASDSQRGGMLLDAPPADASLHAVDVRAFLGAQRIADTVEQGDVVEYWKSAPYLFNFMDDYALKKAFKSTSEKHELVRFVREFPERFSIWSGHAPISRSSRRTRACAGARRYGRSWNVAAALDTAVPWLLRPGRAFRGAGAGQGHKAARLFRLAHGAARCGVARVLRSRTPDDASATSAGRLRKRIGRKQRGLLRFGISADRLTGMPLLLLVYPCLTFARDCDPRDLARGIQLTAAEARLEFAARIRELVESWMIPHETGRQRR